MQHGAVMRGGRPIRRGVWWSIELGVPVEEGMDFIQDSEVGGSDDFIFVPDSEDEGGAEEVAPWTTSSSSQTWRFVVPDSEDEGGEEDVAAATDVIPDSEETHES
ncbi:hypothetical protein E2562_011822 [Oryza meyeriana var. granulata]|uniref:Uncharacterized protein n=1 Tax=Oryza meyeriana var. granulata TaxID=110450 RepID=A0A6G1CQ94_9ORYZ|nr:hypothetical protein E2562_011822 [Oryza meyeriana var. granulata]